MMPARAGRVERVPHRGILHGFGWLVGTGARDSRARRGGARRPPSWVGSGVRSAAGRQPRPTSTSTPSGTTARSQLQGMMASDRWNSHTRGERPPLARPAPTPEDDHEFPRRTAPSRRRAFHITSQLTRWGDHHAPLGRIDYPMQAGLPHAIPALAGPVVPRNRRALTPPDATFDRIGRTCARRFATRSDVRAHPPRC